MVNNKHRSATKSGATKNTVMASDVVDYLKSRIKKGILSPGQRLVEADITRAIGASRSRVRTAFQQMAAEGLITIEEFRGATVKRYTLDEVKDLYMIRKALEGLAARIVTETADPGSLRKIADIQEQMDICAEKNKNAEFARLNNEWHSAIIAAANNTYLTEFIDRLKIPIFRYLLNMFYEGAIVKNANKEHKKITNAILEGNVARAERLMQQHIQSALSQIVSDNDEIFTSF